MGWQCPCQHRVIRTWSSLLSYLLSFSCSVASDQRGTVAMDERIVEAIARCAGLEKALEVHPDDVAAAAAAAEKVTNRIRRSSGTLSEPLSEPWPPMIVVGR